MATEFVDEIFAAEAVSFRARYARSEGQLTSYVGVGAVAVEARRGLDPFFFLTVRVASPLEAVGRQLVIPKVAMMLNRAAIRYPFMTLLAVLRWLIYADLVHSALCFGMVKVWRSKVTT